MVNIKTKKRESFGNLEEEMRVALSFICLNIVEICKHCKLIYRIKFEKVLTDFEINTLRNVGIFFFYKSNTGGYPAPTIQCEFYFCFSTVGLFLRTISVFLMNT